MGWGPGSSCLWGVMSSDRIAEGLMMRVEGWSLIRNYLKLNH